MATVTLTIDDLKYAEFKQYFLMAYPNQTLDDVTPLTDDQWIKRRIMLFAKGGYVKGKREEFEQGGPVLDDDIVSES